MQPLKDAAFTLGHSYCLCALDAHTNLLGFSHVFIINIFKLFHVNLSMGLELWTITIKNKQILSKQSTNALMRVS